MKAYLVCTLFLVFALGAKAQAVKRLYIANDDHTDYMWTGNEAQYDTAFVRMLDYYMRHIDSTRNNPPDFQARFNCDGSYWLRTYQKYRSPAQFDRLMGYVKSGHISSPLNTLVSTYGGQPTEAVLRGMYYAGQLERQYGLRFPLAVCMENQTLPMGLSSLWAGSGARYSWRGVCGCASRIPKANLAHRSHQLYRYTGPDRQGVIMKWYNLIGENTGLGGYGETRPQHKTLGLAGNLAQSIEDLTLLCDTISARSTYPYNVAGAFGYGWDDLSTFVSPAFTTAAQVGTTATRRVRVSNEEDFFRDVERSYPNLPAESVSYGNEWDLYPASMNETTAEVRRATERLRTAEALASLVSLKNPAFLSDLTGARRQAWEAYGLYWEHDWTADGPVSRKERAEWQIKQKNSITAYVDSLYHRSVRAFGATLKATGTATRFYVFNPLSWTRSDVADFALPDASPRKVIDVSTNKEVPSQLIQKGRQTYVRIWAETIPSVGYKVYEVRKGSALRLPQAATVDGEVMQNRYYRLRLRRAGTISELVDRKAGNRSLVRPTNGRYVNDLGTVNPDAGNPVVVEQAGPVSVTLKAVSTDPVPHTVRVTLFANSPRIEIEDSIRANFGDVKTWSFSFDLTNPVTHHEELGAVLTAKKETRGGHYAARNARLDWLTFNHFADLTEPGRNGSGYGVTLSNQDCSFFKLGQSTADSLWEASPVLHALAGGQVDGEKLGIVNQHGNTAFRYQFALTTHAAGFDPVAAMRFSLEHQHPLVTGAVTGTVGHYPATSYSFLTITDPAVLLWSLNPAEDRPGQASAGLITRWWNLGNRPATPTFRFASPIGEAWHTSHLETDERPLAPARGALTDTMQQQQLKTYRLVFNPIR